MDQTDVTDDVIRPRAQRIFELRMAHIDKLGARVAHLKAEAAELQAKIDAMCTEDAHLQDWCAARTAAETEAEQGEIETVHVDEGLHLGELKKEDE